MSWILLVAGLALAHEPEGMAEHLAALRAEVESLSEELTHRQEDLRAELRIAQTARAELETRIREEDARIEALQRALEEHRNTLDAEQESADVLTPELERALTTLRARIQSSLPYRRVERLAAVAELEQSLHRRDLTPEQAASRLWQVAEDELRLARENALDRQVILIDGQEQLAAVARLGLVALYYRTDDGAVGAWNGTTWRPFTEAPARRQVHELFDALAKQVRVGWFELPDPRG